MKNLNKFDITKIWIYLFLVFMLSILFMAISKSLIVTLIIFLIVILLGLKFNISKFPVFIFVFSLVIRLIIVFFVKTPPESDFLILYDASQSLLKGDYSFINNNYFSMWAYQMGFVFVQSLFLRICNSIIFLKIINCVVSSINTLLIYLISKEFTDEKSSKIVAVIYAILPFTLTYVTVLTNQYLASLLIYLAIYMIICKKIKINGTIKYILISILLALANMIRPESIIPLVSIILFLIFTINKKNMKENIFNVVTTIVTYICVTLFISLLFSVSGLAPSGLKSNDPYWKFVLGFNYDTGGSYSDEDAINIGNFDKEIELIKERVFTSPIKLARLFFRKINTFWLNTTLSWSFSYMYDENIMLFGSDISICNVLVIFESVNNCMMCVLYVLLIIGVYRYVKKKNYNRNILLMITQVFVTFVIYLLIEVQFRYSYFIQVSIVILSSLGIHEIIKYIGKKERE